jgi:hypothetical protein
MSVGSGPFCHFCRGLFDLVVDSFRRPTPMLTSRNPYALNDTAHPIQYPSLSMPPTPPLSYSDNSIYYHDDEFYRRHRYLNNQQPMPFSNSPRDNSPPSDTSSQLTRESVPTSPKKRSSRTVVSIACVHCKKAHLACDDERPCRRCTRLGRGDTCIDHVPKKRGRPTLGKPAVLKIVQNRRHSAGAAAPVTSSSYLPTSMDLLAQMAHQESMSLATSPTESAPRTSPNAGLSGSMSSSMPPLSKSDTFFNRPLSTGSMKVDPAVYSVNSPLLLPETSLPAAGDINMRQFDANLVVDVASLVIMGVQPSPQSDLMLVERYTLYDLIHSMDRMKLYDFHRQIREVPTLGHKVNVHFRVRTGQFGFCTIELGSVTSTFYQLLISRYQHPGLNLSSASSPLTPMNQPSEPPSLSLPPISKTVS